MRFVWHWWAGSVQAKGVTTKDAKVHEGNLAARYC